MNLPKWMVIFNSVIRLKFYVYLEMFKPEVISNLDKHFQVFVDNHGLNPNKTDVVRFFGGDMLIGFSYLILVRTFEYIDKDLSDNEKAEVLKIDNWKFLNISTYDDFILKYSITVLKLTDKKGNGDSHYTNDGEKLKYFIYRIRNSVSHHRYTYPDMQTIKLIDKKPKKNSKIEMECTFKYSDFLNFCMDYCHVINDKLYSLHNQ